MGHALQERSQPLELGRAASLGTRHRRRRIPGSRRASCLELLLQTVPEPCQPPPSSNLLPDYVSLDKRELFRPWFRLKQYSELTEGGWVWVWVCSEPPARPAPKSGQQPELLLSSGG